MDVFLLRSLGVPALLFALGGWPRLGRVARAAWLATALMLLAVFVRRLAATGAGMLRRQPPWDGLAHWVYGRAIWRGGPYRPEVLQEVPLPYAPPPDFVQEVLEVGTPYPPPSLGWLALLAPPDLGAALQLRLGLQLWALAACAWVLWRLFLARHGLPGLLASALLLTALPATELTLALAQTQLLVLLILLAAFRDRGRARLGLWIGLGAVVKPWVALLGLLPLLRRRFAPLVVAAGVGLAALAGALAITGPGVLGTWLVDPPHARFPEFVYLQPMNQSLPLTAARIGHELGGRAAEARTLGGLAGAGLLALAAAAVLRRRDDAAALALLVATGLLVYPGTLIHYTVAALLPLGLLQARLAGTTRGAAAVAALLAAVLALTGVGGGELAILAHGLVWAATGALLLRGASAGASGEPALARPRPPGRPGAEAG